MEDNSSKILILEDDVLTSDLLQHQIKRLFPQFQIISARSISEGNILLYQYEFSLFIVDICLPDGDGLDFYSDVKTVYPDSIFIVITGSADSSNLGKKMKSLGIENLMTKPLDLGKFHALIQTLIRPTHPSAQDTFHGAILDLHATDLIQIKCVNKKTTILVMQPNEEEIGRIYIKDGNILHAETNQYEGIQAFNTILQWQQGSFLEQKFTEPPSQTITEGWEGLLLNAVRLTDEQTAEDDKTPQRRIRWKPE